jgi:uncharacterized protein (DUF1501 family)
MRRNKDKQKYDITRRDFMWKSGCASLGVVSMASTIWDLRFMNAALAQNAPGTVNDYKALVCVFLYGGNDANNMVIPTDSTTYNTYTAQRGGAYTATNTTTLAIPTFGTTGTNGTTQIGYLPITPLTSDGHTYALHPAMPELQGLYNSGQMAILLNVGTMVYPFQYGSDSYFGRNGKPKVPQPYQLFSHNDQQIQWQTSVSDVPTSTGWGGRSADMINAAANGTATVSMSISLGGQNTYEVGSNVNEYSISTGGAPAPSGSSLTSGSGTNTQLQALNDLIGYRGSNGTFAADPGWSAALDIKTLHPNLYEQAFAGITRNGINNATVVNAVNNSLSNTDPAFGPMMGYYNNGNTNGTSLSGFGQQLRSVAKMIAGRNTFGHKRQIFFVQMGGYDLHTNQGGYISAVNGSLLSHASLLRDLSRGLAGFYQATVALNVATNVTAFTVSDFSRTFPMNGGLGSDHGWGNHQLIVGGAVLGQRMYGQFTDLAVNGTHDTGTGRWIPTTSCDEYFACLARWYGISTTDIAATVLPNIGHFANNLNFV